MRCKRRENMTLFKIILNIPKSVVGNNIAQKALDLGTNHNTRITLTDLEKLNGIIYILVFLFNLA